MDRRTALAGLAGLSFSAVLAGCGRSGSLSAPPAVPSPTVVRSRPPSAEVTAADFAWFVTDEPGFGEGFTFTWLAGLTPEQVVRRVGGRPMGRHHWDDFPEEPEDGVIIAVTQAGGWSLMVETYTMYGIADAVAELSKDTRLIADYRNVEMDGSFLLAENGETLVQFDPYTPDSRSGSRPDLLLAEMSAVGLDPSGADPSGAELSPDADPSAAAGPRISETEAAFALTERLTGVPFTADLLDSSTYLAVVVPDPFDNATGVENGPRATPS